MRKKLIKEVFQEVSNMFVQVILLLKWHLHSNPVLLTFAQVETLIENQAKILAK
jgi:hypothetical protein